MASSISSNLRILESTSPVKVDSVSSCDITVTRKRTKRDLTPTLVSALRTITAGAETLPVGTFKYKVFKYPGDIDIFEKLEECCTYNQARVKVADKIKSIVKDVLANPEMIFMEFKAGYDQRYRIYTGLIDHNYDDYNPVLIRRDWNNLYDANLLTEKEYTVGNSLIRDGPTMSEVILLNEYLRSFWVLRWSSTEILQGYKVLRGNLRVYLDEALTHGSVVKLDTIAKLETRYVEMTNFFLIKQIDRYGNEIVLSEDLRDYAQSLLGDVYKYYDENRLKAVKRFWMYLAFQNRVCDMSKFAPLFNSDIALVSQVIADIEVVLDLMRSDKRYDSDFMYRSISDRLTMLLGTYIDEPFESSNFDDMYAYLTRTRKDLSNKVNEGTKEWLRDNDIDITAMIQD